MKKYTNKAFTLVELLVVITILAIISVVAYQNFGGAVDKAYSGRKINDITTIETALQQFKVDKNYYPAVGGESNTNKWGYLSGTTATPSNTIVVTYEGEEIDTIVSANGGGKVFGTGAWASKQIGAKGTISRDELTKRYLSKDLYDPEIGDIKVKSTSKTMLEEAGIGRYVYSVYKKPKGNDGVAYSWGASNKTGTNYNIAFTIKKDGTDDYITKIVGDYDEESCYDDSEKCPKTLIGSSSNILIDGDEESDESNQTNYGIPYAIRDFAE